MTIAYRLTPKGRDAARQAGVHLARRSRYQRREHDYQLENFFRDRRLDTARKNVVLYIEWPGGERAVDAVTVFVVVTAIVAVATFTLSFALMGVKG